VLATTLAGVIVLAACGGDDDSADSTTTETDTHDEETTTTAAGVPEVAAQYLGLLGDADLGGMARMVDLAADGSLAELYAQYHIARMRYAGPAPSTSDVKGATVEQCGEEVNAAGGTETVCSVFSDFEVDDAGRLVTFSVDGSAIADRLRAGDPAGVTADGVTVRVVAAYLTAQGDLAVVLDVTNGSEGVAQVDDCAATYTGPDGRQVTQLCVSLLPRVQPGATASVVYIIEQATLGGVLSISAATDEREPGSFYDSVALDIPVPA
jgi:hypothetical protein